jgi:hypothetical protein
VGEYWSAWKNKRRELAEDVSGLKERIGEEIGQRFFARPGARILTSLPGTWGRSSEPSSSWASWATSLLSRVLIG